MADCKEDLHRTDASEVRFQETVPDDQKYTPTKPQGIASVPMGGQDAGIHVDKPTSVTETGYGGISGRGNDISDVVQESRGAGGESITDKAKDVVQGVKDSASGKKQQEASVPVVDQSPPPAHQQKEGLGGKVKDFVTGQKPGHGTGTKEGLSPHAETPSATRTDPHGNPIEGPRDDNPKKEGVMAKVMDKFK